MLGSITYHHGIGIPILSLVLWLPAIGALIVSAIGKEKISLIRSTAFAVAFIDFLFSLPLYFAYQGGTAKMQFVENFSWIPSIGANYHLGVDGISLWMVILTTFMGWITVLSTFTAIKERVKEFMVVILLIQTAMLGVFMSVDLLLFYLFWEAQLVPMFLMIGVWGAGRKIYSSYKFFIYTVVGSFPLVLGLLAVYYNYHDYALAHHLSVKYTFDILRLYTAPLPSFTQMWVFWVLFLAFAIKVPMIPFHTWLPDVHVDAPTAGSVILAAILLKMGAYGFYRFSIPLLPAANFKFYPYVMFISGVAIVYASWVCMNQVDMKKLVAFSSVAHMGYITMGIFVLNQYGLEGGILQMVNHGISSGGLFLVVGLIYDRRHTRDIQEFGGLFKILPIFTAYFATIMLSSMGMPGMNGFVGELFVIIGTFQTSLVYGLITVAGILFCAAYLLWMFQRVALGKPVNPKNAGLKDLSFREQMTMAPLVVAIFLIGLYPKPFVKTIRPGVANLLSLVREGRSLDDHEVEAVMSHLHPKQHKIFDLRMIRKMAGETQTRPQTVKAVSAKPEKPPLKPTEISNNMILKNRYLD
ncbi:MAG: NuoM family protein [bacterium]